MEVGRAIPKPLQLPLDFLEHLFKEAIQFLWLVLHEAAQTRFGIHGFRESYCFFTSRGDAVFVSQSFNYRRDLF